ncbi:MAG: SDR family NAD(P)-dependent oxidoreductase [Natronospirillum sp.]
MKLSGRTILITGGSSGIGLELAEQLMGKGNTVIITGRNEQALEAVKRRLPGIETLQSDVSNMMEIRSLYERVESRFPKLDTLINNAGIMRILKLNEDNALDDLTAEIDINLNGTMRMVQAFFPLLNRQSNGLIVNISSGLAFVPFPLSPAYSAAKAGVHAYTRCLRVQLKETAVNVVELAPPLTETPLYQAEFAKKMNGQRGMPVDTLVRKAIASIESGKTEIRPGQSNLLKIASRVAPGLMFNVFSKVK